MNQAKKGFTLIELLVVVSIIAILSVFVILTLNPAQMLKQARDSQRISDMSTLKSAIALYLADVANPAGNALGASSTCYTAANLGATPSSSCIARMAAGDTAIATTTIVSSTLVGGVMGVGWIPVNFSAISAGSPIGSEPIDPINNATYFYSYATNAAPSYQFEVDAKMESTKYSASGTADVESTDGGSSSTIYEVGSNLTL